MHAMHAMHALVTGSSGAAGRAVCDLLTARGDVVRMADVTPPTVLPSPPHSFVRCDTRTPADVAAAMEGVEAVVHLAAWHCGHAPPVSDPTIFSVNVDGTFNVVQAARAAKVRALVYASSMAIGFAGVYGVTKVVGEDLCRMFHESTGEPAVSLRYHAFTPLPYLAHLGRAFRNGVDVADVATATLAALDAAMAGRVELFTTIVHSDHAMPPHVRDDFAVLGLDWCEAQVPGSADLLRRYEVDLPGRVEQHDLSAARDRLGWTPGVGATAALEDFVRRVNGGEDVRRLTVHGGLGHVRPS